MARSTQDIIPHGESHTRVDMVRAANVLQCHTCGVAIDAGLILPDASATCNGTLIQKKA